MYDRTHDGAMCIDDCVSINFSLCMTSSYASAFMP